MLNKLCSNFRNIHTFPLLIVSFLLILTITDFNNLDKVRQNKRNTDELVENFRQTYDLQKQISLTYQAVFDQLSRCTDTNPVNACSPASLTKLTQDTVEIRNNYINQLDKVNQQTEVLIKKVQ